MKVIAFEVDHGDVIKPCYGYRFEYGGRVAVFSSDTRYSLSNCSELRPPFTEK